MSSSKTTGFVVAIDGPAGAGKSTVARGLAARLGYTFLDTGALYRTVALVARQRDVPWDDGMRLGTLAGATEIGFVPDARGTRVWADGQDVTEAIREAQISQGASRVSAIPEVRVALLDLQRRAAAKANVVAEGRDIGTVVFPAAEAKFFLIADLETRARRRTEELHAAGGEPRYAEVLAEMQMRDARDSERAVAPLRRAPDAIEIDSSRLSPDQVMEQMIAVVRARGG